MNSLTLSPESFLGSLGNQYQICCIGKYQTLMLTGSRYDNRKRSISFSCGVSSERRTEQNCFLIKWKKEFNTQYTQFILTGIY